MERNGFGQIDCPIAESFTTRDGVEVICVEDIREKLNCEGCFFIGKDMGDCPACISRNRSDGKNVIFKVLYDPFKSEPKTYFEVDEEFQMGLKRFRCIENNVSSDLCHGCAFYDNNIRAIRDYLGYCCAADRPDHKNVIFVELKLDKDGK